MVRFITFLFLSFMFSVQLEAQDIDCCTCVYIEDPAVFRMDSSSTFMKFIAENINYPDSALQMGIEGNCIVKFWINQQGLSEDITLLRTTNHVFDKESVRVISVMKFDRPALQFQKPVRQLMVIPVVFRLPK